MRRNVSTETSPGIDRAEQASPLPRLFEPFTLRSVTFKNRIIVTPMCQYCAEDGHATQWHLSHHGRFALGGVGGALVEATAITREGRITHGCLGIYLDSHIAQLKTIVSIYHAENAPVGIQIGHSGRKGSAAVPLEGAAPLIQHDPERAWEPIGPSPIPLGEGWPTPREMAHDEIEGMIESFRAAARRALEAGFDFLEIHGAHGYLLHSFFSPISNQRRDDWGGSLEKRMRLPLRIAEALRDMLPHDMPLFYRTSSVDGVEGGVTIEDNVVLARALKARGVDLIDCSSGGITGASGKASRPPAPGYLVPYAAEIRKGADIATMAVGLILTAEQAEDIIARGDADLVALGRQLIFDPNFAYHAALELGHPRPHDILPESYGFFLKRRKIDSDQE